MDYKKIEKVHAGKFLDYYNVTYVDGAGNEKVYEMVSRDHELHSDTQLHDHPTDAVVMIINDPSDEHILLVREFRCELGKVISVCLQASSTPVKPQKNVPSVS